jgi:HlyD family secretion protein
MNSAAFRQTAVDRMQQPERQEELLAITRPRDWLGMVAITLILATAGYWGWQGRVSTKVEGQGVLVLTGGVVNVFSEAPGRIASLRVKAGDEVKQGQVIGVVAQPGLEGRIRSLLESRAELERERSRSAGVRSEGLQLQNEVTRNQIANLQREIVSSRQQIRTLDEQSQTEEELLAKGLITKQQLLTTRQKRASIEASIASTEAQIKQVQSARFQNETQAEQADRDIAARIAEMDRNISSVQRELASAAEIRSAYTGKVIEVKVYPGVLVGSGEPVVSLEPSAGSIEAIAYVNAVQAKEIRKGMSAELVPSMVKREEFGFVRARVVSVAEFPATRAAMMRTFENDAVVQTLTTSGAVSEVRLALEPDAATPSGFRWSSSRGPSIRLTSGTFCTASIVTREQRPIELVAPFLRKKLGL